MKLTQLRRLYRGFKSRGDYPLPATLIATSVVLASVALIVGLILDWKSLTVNVSSSLVILGPGLVITNLLVKIWSDSKAAKRVEPTLKILVSTLIKGPYYLVTDTASKLGIKLDTSTWDALLTEDVFIKVPDLSEVHAVLNSVYQEFAASEVVSSIRDRTDDIDVTQYGLQFPHYPFLERLVGHIDSLRPAPESYIRASLLRLTYESPEFRTVYHPRIEGKATVSGTLVVVIGFESLRRHAMECQVPKDAESPLQVWAMQYYEAVRRLFLNNVELISELNDELSFASTE